MEPKMTRLEEINGLIEALQREKAKLTYPRSTKEVPDMFSHPSLDFEKELNRRHNELYHTQPDPRETAMENVDDMGTNTVDARLSEIMSSIYFTRTYLMSVYDRLGFTFLGGKSPLETVQVDEVIPEYNGILQSLEYIESQLECIHNAKNAINELWNEHINFNGK